MFVCWGLSTTSQGLYFQAEGWTYAKIKKEVNCPVRLIKKRCLIVVGNSICLLSVESKSCDAKGIMLAINHFVVAGFIIFK